jgi:protein-disulfide isomerase
VTLVIWGDFQCPFCGRFARLTEPRLIADYVDRAQLRIVYRDWVFIGVESVAAAVAARCAADQNRFWLFHDYLLWNQGAENAGGFSDERLDAMATAVGLDLTAFHLCTLDTSRIDAVKRETEAGTQAGIGMTPTLVVGGSSMPGAATSDEDYGRLRVVIDAAIAAGPAKSPPTVIPSPSP